jgi:hypothetical protein
LGSLRPARRDELTVLGALTDEHDYQSFLRELEQAQTEICYWMLASPPETAASVLQDRAAAGVRVRLLLANASVVTALRGGTAASLARTAITGWAANAAEVEGIELRLVSRVSDAYLAGSMLIDDVLVRIDVYDPERQRGMDGLMLEARSSEAGGLNLVRLYKQAFDDAWGRAAAPSRWGRLSSSLQRRWRWYLAAAAALLSLPLGGAWRQIMYSVSGTVLALAVIEDWPVRGLRRLWRRLRA